MTIELDPPPLKSRVYKHSYSWEELNAKPILGREESAYFLGVSLRALDLRLPAIPHSKFGGRVLIRKSALLDYLAQTEERPTKKVRKKAA
jgi:hypothetical protein